MPLITFEGIEGCGKSTQVRLLTERLESEGYAVSTTREPGGTPLGEQIRGIVKHAEYPICDESELLLFAAARAQIVREIIRPAVERGEVVICDRFTLSTLAYQGGGRGLDIEFIRRLNDFATSGLKPDLTVLLDVPVEVGLARAAKRAAAGDESIDRIEAQKLDFFQRVRAAYVEAQSSGFHAENTLTVPVNANLWATPSEREAAAQSDIAATAELIGAFVLRHEIMESATKRSGISM